MPPEAFSAGLRRIKAPGDYHATRPAHRGVVKLYKNPREAFKSNTRCGCAVCR